MVKISWPEAARLNEVSVIEETQRLGDDKEHIREQVPTVIW